MQPNTQTMPAPPSGGGSSGAGRKSTRYVGVDGRYRTSRIPVPVDRFGRIASSGWQCSKCVEPEWLPLNTKDRPVCAVHDRHMEPLRIQRPPVLPSRELWDAVRRPLRPVWALPAMAAAGVVVDAAPIPAFAILVAAPVAGVGAQRMVRRAMASRAAKGVLGDAEDAERYRVLVAELAHTFARPARLVGYGAAAGLGWLSLAAAVDAAHPTALAAAALAAAGLAAWLPFAGAWWRKLREERDRPAPVVEALQPEVRVRSADELDADEAARAWRDEVAAAGTTLDPATWTRIPCGWQAVIAATKRGALNALGGESNTPATIRRVAAAFDVPRSAVTWIEEFEDSPNKALLLVQPSNPLAEPQVWAGPSTIDVKRGVAESGRLINGDVMWDTWFRYGWGAPSEVALGTTGGGKSQRARKKMVAERWTYHVVDGLPRGLFVTLLHDPKRLESYAEFRDAIHGYGITRDDAHIIIDALLREMFRRYDYLSSLEWTDSKGRTRRGGVAWNPLVHGPIISHFWDEFHELAGDAEFVKKLEKLARYQRACAMRATLLSHMGTLGDTGSQALRDMLAGGRSTLFRTTSALNAGLVSGGQLTVDPRTLPRTPGMCFVIDGDTPAIMGRESYLPGEEEPGNVYDWLFDDANNPIGHPAEIPPETAEAFGPEFMEWMAAGRAPGGRGAGPRRSSAAPAEDQGSRPDVRHCLDVVTAALLASLEPLDMNALSTAAARTGGNFPTRTIRSALTKLHEAGSLFKTGNGPGTRYELTPQARETLSGRSDEDEQVRAAEGDAE